MDPSLQDENMEDFSSWLTGVVSRYRSLSNDNKNVLLDTLIANSMVCKSWKQRIDSLTDLWQNKAWEMGVDIQAIPFGKNALSEDKGMSANLPSTFDCNERARIYKAVYCRAEKFLDGLKRSGHCVTLARDFICTEDKKITHFYFKDGNIFTGHSNCLQMWSLLGGNLEKVMNITSQTKILFYHNSQLYTSSLCSTVERWSINSSEKHQMHSGHHNVVLTLDISIDEDFVITGSMDKSIKLWDIQNSELLITLDNAHAEGVIKVNFLPHGEHGELRFISCDTNDFFSWSLDVTSRHVKFNHACPLTGQERIASYYFDSSKPDTLYTSIWNDEKRMSCFSSYHLDKDTTSIRHKDCWEPLLNGVKAHLLGIGKRFALFYCSISCQDLYLYDLLFKRHLVTIVTPFFGYEALRNTPNCQLCETSWLDGFEFDKMQSTETVLVARGSYNSVMTGTWNVPKEEEDDIFFPFSPS